MSFITIIVVIGVVIIISLGAYAFHLIKLVKQQDERQKQAEANAELVIRNKQTDLLKDIRFLARSTLQEQCEITEAVLRLHYAINKLDPTIWEFAELQHIRDHHQHTCDMPILDAYKNVTKKEQIQIDKKRWQLEDKNKSNIQKELQWLVEYPFPKVTMLQ